MSLNKIQRPLLILSPFAHCARDVALKKYTIRASACPGSQLPFRAFKQPAFVRFGEYGKTIANAVAGGLISKIATMQKRACGLSMLIVCINIIDTRFTLA